MTRTNFNRCKKKRRDNDIIMNTNKDHTGTYKDEPVEHKFLLSEVLVKQEFTDNFGVNEGQSTEQPIPFLTVLVKEEPTDNFVNENELVRNTDSSFEEKRRLGQIREKLSKYEATSKQMLTGNELKGKGSAEASPEQSKSEMQRNTAPQKQRHQNVFVKDELIEVIVKEELLIDDEYDRSVNEVREMITLGDKYSIHVDTVERGDWKESCQPESKIERKRRLARESQARYKERRKQILTENQLKEKRAANALATKLARQNETPEQTEARRLQQRKRVKMRRLNETPEQTAARRLEQRERIKMNRLIETPEKTEARRLQQRERVKLRRLNKLKPTD